MASFEQDLEDDVVMLIPSSLSPEEWTCKKCTLVNSHQVKACIVCGGSQLKSVSAAEDMTLRKGEFWSCQQCTLKNSLDTKTCIACKSIRLLPTISGQHTQFRPYTSSPQQQNIKLIQLPYQHQIHSNSGRQVAPPQNSTGVTSPLTTSMSANTTVNTATTPNATTNTSLMFPPVNRVSRSPSPKYDRIASGAVPKVCSI